MHSDDAWSAVAELGASQHGAFTRRQASLKGVTARDVRRLRDLGLVREPIAGVLVFAGAPDTVRRRLWIATSASGGGFAAAFRAAAWLHGLDGFDREPPIEVLGHRGRRIVGVPDLVPHWGRLDVDDRTVVDSIPCTNVARTVCDLASVVGPDGALRLIDDVERNGYSLRWLAETADRLHRPGQAGTGIVRRLLDQRSGRAPDTWFEHLVGRCLRIPGLPPWTRQHEVFDDSGQFVARIDLACVPLRLGVEAHSKRFHFGVGRGRDDQGRDDDLAAVGWDVRYVGWHATTLTPEEVAATIERVARRRAVDLGVALPWAA